MLKILLKIWLKGFIRFKNVHLLLYTIYNDIYEITL